MVPKVVESLVEGITSSILEAYQDISEAKIYYQEGSFEDEDVSFNRSMEAYLKNPEVKNKEISKKDAAPKKVRMFVIEKDNSKAFINWFPVHCTSIGSTNRDIHSDNKGMASKISEEKNIKLAIFSQECSGDISPNYIKTSKRHRGFRGKFEDDFKSAEHNGKLQADKAFEIISNSEKVEIKGSIYSDLLFIDFAKLKISDDIKTSSGALGVSFLLGSPSDGRAFHDAIGFAFKIIAGSFNKFYLVKNFFLNKKRFHYKIDKRKSQGKKVMVLETGDKDFISDSKTWVLKTLSFIDPLMAQFGKQYFDNAMDENTWLQEILPVQFTKIGQFLILSLPFEPTTISGLRIKRALKPILEKNNISKLIMNPYSNSYAGYITTPEEYDVQTYEGGHTLFGKYTLPCLINELEKKLNEFFSNNDIDKTLQPPVFSELEIKRRTNNYL